MCERALTLHGGCLEDWGVRWEAAGLDDGDGLLAACDTWSREPSRLQDAATQPGELDHTATRSAYTGNDWNTTPREAR